MTVRVLVDFCANIETTRGNAASVYYRQHPELMAIADTRVSINKHANHG